MKYAFNYLLLLAFVLLSHVAVAQTQPQVNSNAASFTEKQKQKFADMTIGEFLKTPKGMALSAQDKADLGKIPPQTKLSKVLEELEKAAAPSTAANKPNVGLYFNNYYSIINRGTWCWCCFYVKVDGTPYPCSCCQTTPPATPVVVNRTETLGGVNVKIYLKEPAASTNRKGIVVIGSGNNEMAPTPGSLTGGLENALCQKLAEEGYIGAIVQYNVPAVTSNYSNWNDVSIALAAEYNKAINGIIGKYGGSRSQVIAAGVSFTTFSLLTNIAYNNDLADIKGFMGSCGGTGTDQASRFKIPVASISCSDDFEAQYILNGEDLVNAITNPTIKNQSIGLRDQTCSGHCNGNTTTWVNWLVNRVKIWLP